MVKPCEPKPMRSVQASNTRYCSEFGKKSSSFGVASPIAESVVKTKTIRTMYLSRILKGFCLILMPPCCVGKTGLAQSKCTKESYVEGLAGQSTVRFFFVGLCCTSIERPPFPVTI